jgi:LPS-assembly protein
MRPASPLLVAILLASALVAPPAWAPAQNLDAAAEGARLPVALVADSVIYDQRTGLVVAEGNVEVYQGTRTLTATRIEYDSRAGRIAAEGPLALRDGEGVTVLADTAELDESLREGIIEGARAIIASPDDGAGGTIAAVTAERVEGRFNVLSKAVYSPCEVCPAQPRPLWQIRASNIVHDEQERMVYYENAVFDVAGVPVAYLPFFSHPDPTVERKTGLLTPTFSNSTTYGYAVSIPYFIALDESRDIMLTAFPTTRDGPIGFAEYRQAFDSGFLRLETSFGVLDTDPEGGSEARGHLFANGGFGLGRVSLGAFGETAPITTGAQVQLTSDDAYLARYDISEADRLESFGFVESYGRDGVFRLSGTSFDSLREFEPDGDRLLALPEFNSRYAMELGEDVTGFRDLGRLGVEANSLVLARSDGRDTTRLSLGGDWSAEAITDVGLTLGGFAEARMDGYWVSDDPDFDGGAAFRLYPQAGVEARYPVIATLGRSNHLLEPIARLIVAPDEIDAGDIPNEDSIVVEFDEANLFDNNRFPGFDRVETGTRLNVGLRYARVADDAFTLDGTVGRVFRLNEEGAFSPGSGLAPRQSDYVAAVGVGYAPYVRVANRLRFNNDFEFNRVEIEGALTLPRMTLTTSYVYLGEDPQAFALEEQSAFNAAAIVDVTRNWRVGGELRQDLEEGETVLLAGSLGYRTECAEFEVYADRSFPDRRENEAETSVGFRFQLFGVSRPGLRRGACAVAP